MKKLFQTSECDISEGSSVISFGNIFLVNGKPFFILFHISCGILKYATQVRVYKLCIKTTYERLFCESKIPRSLITQQDFFGKWLLPGFWKPCKF